MKVFLRMLIGLFVLGTIAHATTYSVCSSGCNFTTINGAANTVVAGDTVVVHNGTYSEDVYIGHSGTSSNRITFKSQNKYGAVVSSSGSTQANLVVDIAGNYVTWQDFEVIGRTTTASGIKCNSGVACWILGNKIHDIGVNTSTCIFGGGILDSSGSSVIDGNYIYNVSPPRTVSFRCNKQHGIYVDSDAGSPGVGGKVTNNLIMEIWSGWGIQLWSFNPNGWTVANNTVVNTGYAAQNVGGPLIIDCGIDSSTTGTCNNNKFTNNILEHGFGGSSNYCFQQASSGSASPWGSNNVYDHNLLFDCGSNLMLSGQTVTNSVTSDAQFVNYTGTPSGDYQLQASSPAIDSGTSNGCPSTDFLGVSRPQGSVCDRGVYEVGASGGPPAAPTNLTATPF